MEARERLFITADKKRLVAEGDQAGAFLYAAPGDLIPDSAAEMFGLVDGRIATIAEEKRREGGGDKSRKDGEDKDREDGGDKDNRESKAAGGGGAKDASTAAPNDLSTIHGIGAKTAAMLAAAGIDSFARLAALDAAKPPEIDGLNPRAAWGDWIAAAAEKAVSTEPAPGLTIGKEA